MIRKFGFTLIELLVVIAIIAILAAITMPVYMRAKDAAYRNSDIANMNSLRTALQLYRADQGGYPPALLGYVSLYQSGPNMGNVMPANEISSFLYPKRVDSLKTFTPAYNQRTTLDTTTAVWPSADPRGVGSAPILDLDGDNAITAADDYPNARQAFGPASGFVALGGVTPNQASALRFYSISGYDVGLVPPVGGGPRAELRYALFWTVWGLGGGDGHDDPRQLGYDDPPENTVVTWDSWFRDYAIGQVTRSKRDIVLFLGGSARPFDSRNLADRSWRVLP